jgi:hypothetical protein
MSHIDFCLEIAEAITSHHNQHATLMIWAPTGKGKSYAGGSIGERVSQYVAEIKGGSPEDYFTPENIAVITQNEVLRVMSTKMDKKYVTIGFDDIGLAWNSRDFMSEFNKCMNDIAQTIRTRNLFAYFTLPDPSLIDKVPRDLIKYVMKIETSNFDLGYVVAKIQEPMKKVQWGKKIYPYLLDEDGQRIVRHIIFRPSQGWINNYEPRRQEIEHQNTDITVQTMQHIVEEESTPQEPHSSKRSILSRAVKIDYNGGEGLSMEKLADKYGVSKSTIHQALLFQEPKKIENTVEPKKI